MTRAHPVFGVGPGNWPVVYPKYASRNDPSLSQDEGLTSNPWPSSDWVAFLSERGVIGFGLLLAAMFGLLGRAVRDIGGRDSRDPEGVLTAIALVGTLAATAVVGAFDAVLLLGLPAFFFWTLAGALVPPAKSDARISKAAKIGAGVMLVVVSIGVLRSATQLAAMGVYSSSTRLSALEQSASLDPGNYRIRMRLAQAYVARGDCTRARAQARAARDLFPNAGEPKRILAACGAR
ncbi:MAG TPA: tetratricopeptide repeat protein, partial [Gemmatimonadaceae bacterium]